jgi:hypothetical protein
MRQNLIPARIFETTDFTDNDFSYYFTEEGAESAGK